VQFTSAPFLTELETQGVRISMDGKGRFLDNIFIERLWRSLKYEEVFIKAYGSAREARLGIGGWLAFYDDDRPHQALDYRTPRAVFEDAACNHVDNAPAALSRRRGGLLHRASHRTGRAEPHPAPWVDIRSPA
jgi:putative transposase